MASFSFKTAKALGLDVTPLARPDVSPRDLVFAMEVASVSFPQMIVRRAVFAATAMLLGSDWAFAQVTPRLCGKRVTLSDNFGADRKKNRSPGGTTQKTGCLAGRGYSGGGT